MPQAHRHGDSRVCGATTVVQNQSSVYVNGVLWSVEGSINSHGEGGLIPTTGQSVYIEGINVIVHGADNANPDLLCPVIGEPHCDPATAGGSPDTFAY